MNRVICVGDGFAHGHIWPEWPQIIRALLPDQETEIISGIGAGNEFLINGLLSIQPDQDTVIFQWAHANRFDKIVENETWEILAQSDDAYRENFYQRSTHRWWLSSASQLQEIQEYHRFYIQPSQSQQRLHDQKLLVQGFLISRQCQYLAISTQEQDRFSREDRFQSIRGHEIQPSPLVHMAYLEEKILPQLDITVDQQRIDRLKYLMNQTQWIPYDPDRSSIWEGIIKRL